MEPNGIAEIKFRAKDQMALMHNADHYIGNARRFSSDLELQE